MSYELLHEATGQEDDIAAKYDVPTFDDYKLDPSCVRELTEYQRLAFTLVYFIHCAGEMPRTIIINRAKAIDLLEELGEVPKEIEGVPLSFDEKMIFRQACLA